MSQSAIDIERAVQLKIELDALRPLDSDQEARIWQKFRFDWNYHSNNIEGNSLTFGETKSLLLHNITAQGKPIKDHLEIQGHNEAINEILDIAKKKEPLTEYALRSLHKLLLREGYFSEAMTVDGLSTRKWVDPGRYKSSPNHVQTVTGEIFRFAEPIDVPAKMQELVEQFNSYEKGDDAEAIWWAAKLHYDFVLIHPFDDGNGRMARLLMNLALVSQGYPPAIVKTEDKNNYFSALRQADGGQLDVFAAYIARCVSHSLEIEIRGANGEAIDDIDTDSKRIQLLEKALAERHIAISQTKSTESTMHVFKNVFNPLARRLSAKGYEFKRFYFALHESVAIDHNATALQENIDVTLGAIALSLKGSETELRYRADFRGLKFRSLEKFRYGWRLEVRMKNSYYDVVAVADRENGNSNAMSITKNYGDAIAEDDALAITRFFNKDHLEIISSTASIDGSIIGLK